MEFLLQGDYSELCCCLSIIYSVVVLRKGKCATECWKNILDRTKYVPLSVDNQKAKNVFLVLRHSMTCRQSKLAEELGVDIKKYRDLEKGRGLPDSELLWRLYDSFHISPMVLLKDRKGLACEISSLMEAVENEKGNVLFEIIKTLQEKE